MRCYLNAIVGGDVTVVTNLNDNILDLDEREDIDCLKMKEWPIASDSFTVQGRFSHKVTDHQTTSGDAWPGLRSRGVNVIWTW